MKIDRLKKVAILIATKRNQIDFDSNYNQAKWGYVGSRGINDSYIRKSLNEIRNIPLTDIDYLDKFKSWILAYQHNSIIGLDDYHMNFSHGTTQSFDSFYIRHHSRRFRFFPEEYPYHYVQTRYSMNYEFLKVSNLDLQDNDAVILSFPYANTGNKHNATDVILKMCEQKGIPVLLDCCYYFISANQEINLNHECIDTVTFSLSKLFPVGHSRIGIRFSNHHDGQNILQEHKYINEMSAYIGYTLMGKYSPDYIYNKYRQVQVEICDYLDIIPSESVLFGITTDIGAVPYSRDIMGKTHGIIINDSNEYRLGIVNLIEEWEWIKNVIDI